MVAAMKEDRSVGGADLNRFAISFVFPKITGLKILWRLTNLQCQQVADDGPIGFCKLRGNKSLYGAMADGEGTGEAQKGETEVTLFESKFASKVFPAGG